MTGLGKKAIVGSLLMALLALVSTGCGQSGAHKQVTIRFWNGFTGPDGRTMLNIVKRFNAENPDIHVIMQRVEWATYYNKLFVAGLNHRAPELFVIHSNAMPRFAEARFLRPTDELVSAPDGVPLSDLDPNVWQTVEYHGQHWGVPLDVHAMGMYVNKALFRQAGLVNAQGEPQIPTNRDEFVAALRKITKPAQNGKPAQWGFVFTNLTSNAYTIMKQFGGEFFTPDNSRCIMNNRENQEALQFCFDLIRKEHLVAPPENFSSWIGFRQGKVAMVWEGIYMLSDVRKEKDLDSMGAPVPIVGSVKADWAGSHNLCMRADLKGDTLAAARRLVKYLSDNSLDWADGGQIPARISLRNTPRFKAMSVQSAFASQIPYVTYQPRLTFVFEFNTALDQAVEKVMRGSATPQEALAEAEAKVNGIIQRRQRDLKEAGLADANTSEASPLITHHSSLITSAGGQP